MQQNKKSPDELNYKQAYLYLFQQVTDTIKKLKSVQRKSEKICIDETTTKSIEINTEEVLRELIDNIKNNP